jgi:hypothetical protein
MSSLTNHISDILEPGTIVKTLPGNEIIVFGIGGLLKLKYKFVYDNFAYRLLSKFFTVMALKVGEKLI